MPNLQEDTIASHLLFRGLIKDVHEEQAVCSILK